MDQAEPQARVKGSIPDLPRNVPHRAYGLLAWLGRFWFRTSGWRICGDLPDTAHCIAAVAPHSSNWDFIHGVAFVFAVGLRVSFVGKDALFRGPLAGFMRWLGGIPVDRSRSNGLVEVMVDALSEGSAGMWLAIAPEGTRTKGNAFKSGFYRIALGARVPILPVVLNYRERTLTLLPVVTARSDVDRGVAELAVLFESYGARRDWRDSCSATEPTI